MKQQWLRDETTGRIIGKFDNSYWFSSYYEEENYKDHRVDNVIFPIHNDYQASEVTITYLDGK